MEKDYSKVLSVCMQKASDGIKNMAGKILLPLIYGVTIIFYYDIMFIPKSGLDFANIMAPMLLFGILVIINLTVWQMTNMSPMPRFIIKIFTICYDHLITPINTELENNFTGFLMSTVLFTILSYIAAYQKHEGMKQLSLNFQKELILGCLIVILFSYLFYAINRLLVKLINTRIKK